MIDRKKKKRGLMVTLPIKILGTLNLTNKKACKRLEKFKHFYIITTANNLFDDIRLFVYDDYLPTKTIVFMNDHESGQDYGGFKVVKEYDRLFPFDIVNDNNGSTKIEVIMHKEKKEKPIEQPVKKPVEPPSEPEQTEEQLKKAIKKILFELNITK